MQKRLSRTVLNYKTYRIYKEEISKHNLNFARGISFVVSLYCGVLFVISLFSNDYLSITEAYLIPLVVCLCVYISIKVFKEKLQHYSLFLLYLCMFVMLTIALLLGIGQPKFNSTSMVVLMIALPLFIVDNPIRINLFLGVYVIVFCILVSIYKDPAYAKMDVVNTLIYYFAGFVTSYQSVSSKVRNVMNVYQLREQRDRDDLTNLLNRGAFENIVNEYVHSQKDNAIMMIIDVDDFKGINDTYGHGIGDDVLTFVGSTLNTIFRHGDAICRFGGDEFMVFLPNVKNNEIVLERVNKLLSIITMSDDMDVQVGLSIGIVFYPHYGEDFNSLYKKADEALYHAKENGKNQYVVYRKE